MVHRGKALIVKAPESILAKTFVVPSEIVGSHLVHRDGHNEFWRKAFFGLSLGGLCHGSMGCKEQDKADALPKKRGVQRHEQWAGL